MVASLRFGYFSASRFLMNEIHSFWFAALSAPVMMANSPLPPRIRAASSVSVLPMPSERRLVDEEIARVRIRVRVPRHHVDAALARLPEHARDAAAVLDRDRDHVDLSRDPVLDELVLLGGVESGRAVPDQLDAELLRRLLRTRPAADEIRIALGLRHHRDRPAGACPRAAGAPAGAAREPPSAASGPATRWCRPRSASRRSRPRTTRPPGHSSRRVLVCDHGVTVPLWSGRVRPAAAATPYDSTRTLRASIDVATSSAPVRTPVSSDGSAARCSPLRNTDSDEQPDERTPHRAAAAEYRRAAEHHRGDRIELVAGPCIRLRLTEMRHIDDGGKARHHAGEDIHERDPTLQRECRRTARPRR